MGYYDLGKHSWPVTTPAPEAQTWFDRGLVWAYGFNHEEAVYCFEQALRADPDCAMAHWGVAFALGPNYNKPWEAFDEADLRTSTERADAAVTRAGQLAAGVTPAERALIGALRARYAPAELPGQREVWNERYAAAMGRVYQEFPDDPDVAALYADALMNLTPWELWDLRTGSPAAGAQIARQTAAELEAAIPEQLLRVTSPPMADWLEGFGRILVEHGAQREPALADPEPDPGAARAFGQAAPGQDQAAAHRDGDQLDQVAGTGGWLGGRRRLAQRERPARAGRQVAGLGGQGAAGQAGPAGQGRNGQVGHRVQVAGQPGPQMLPEQDGAGLGQRGRGRGTPGAGGGLAQPGVQAEQGGEVIGFGGDRVGVHREGQVLVDAGVGPPDPGRVGVGRGVGPGRAGGVHRPAVVAALQVDGGHHGPAAGLVGPAWWRPAWSGPASFQRPMWWEQATTPGRMPSVIQALATK